jgi:hypothetical protein
MDRDDHKTLIEELADAADDVAKFIVLLILFPMMVVAAMGAAEWLS